MPKGSIQVSVFKNRVEISNPGTLPPELDISDLKEPHSSYPHNPLLAGCMSLTGEIERFGTGTLEMYNLIKERGLKPPLISLEELEPKYREIGFQLEDGNNYYYFSRPNESNQNVESKIEKALRWLDILAFFTTFRKDLCRGARFQPYDILKQVEINLSLKEQLAELQKRTNPGKNYQEMLNDLITEIQKEGFIDLENEMDQTWKILDSWDYMEKLVMAVNIQDDETQNQPEEIN